MKIDGIELKWLGHSSFLIKNSRVIYIDPFNIKDDSEKADLILISHSHYDHCSIEDIKKISSPSTEIAIPADCQSKILRLEQFKKMRIITPNTSFKFGDFEVLTIPAYNVDKSFHPKSLLGMGFLIKEKGVTIYHAGDTDIIPEMEKLTGYKRNGNELIALLPVGGRFTMNSEEAAHAAEIIKPSLAIPMHYGTIVGDEKDAKEFVELCEEEGIKAEILKKE